MLDKCHDCIEACAIDVYVSSGKITIASCYRPPDGPTIGSAHWERFLAQFHNPGVFCGDFNVHNTIWGDSKDYSSSSNLEIALTDTEFVCVNNDSVTHIDFDRNTGFVTDLFIVSSELDLDASWKVESDLLGSDHFPINLTLGTSPCSNITHRKQPRLYSKKTDWGSVMNSWKLLVPNMMDLLDSSSDVEVVYSSFISGIVSAFDNGSYNSLGSLNRSRRKICPPAPWWNEHCDTLIKDRLLALNKFKTSGSRVDYLEYKKREAIARIGLRNVKRESSKSFCESLSRDSNPGYIWKKIKCFKNRFNFAETGNKYNPEKINAILSQIDEIALLWAHTDTLKFSYANNLPS